MSLRRPTTRVDTPSAAPAFDIELLDVTRLDVVIDTNTSTGLPLTFELEKTDSFTLPKGAAKWMVINLGESVMRISAARILYFATRPDKKKVITKS